MRGIYPEPRRFSIRVRKRTRARLVCSRRFERKTKRRASALRSRCRRSDGGIGSHHLTPPRAFRVARRAGRAPRRPRVRLRRRLRRRLRFRRRGLRRRLRFRGRLDRRLRLRGRLDRSLRSRVRVGGERKPRRSLRRRFRLSDNRDLQRRLRLNRSLHRRGFPRLLTLLRRLQRRREEARLPPARALRAPRSSPTPGSTR